MTTLRMAQTPPRRHPPGLTRRDGQDVTFMIVDDDSITVMALKRELRRLDIANPVRVARDGVEALEMLRGDPEVTELQKPYVLTLDINMPRMGGLEFLDEVRRDPSLRSIVVFILTTSDTPSDVAHAYSKNVAGYIVKDDLRASLGRALEMIRDYSQVVELPN